MQQGDKLASGGKSVFELGMYYIDGGINVQFGMENEVGSHHRRSSLFPCLAENRYGLAPLKVTVHRLQQPSIISADAFNDDQFVLDRPCKHVPFVLWCFADTHEHIDS